MRARELAALQRLTAMILAAGEARLAALRLREAGIVAQIDALDAALLRRAREARPEDTALRAGVDLRWEGWADGQRRALLMAQARLRAAMEQEQALLRRDFGRNAAVGALARKAGAAARTAARRRQERGG